MSAIAELFPVYANKKVALPVVDVGNLQVEEMTLMVEACTTIKILHLQTQKHCTVD